MHDFNRITNQLLASANHGRIGIRSFESLATGISKQLRSDAGCSWLRYWGHSINIDEHEQEKIVDPKVLAVIVRLAKTEQIPGKVYHAGLIHTYGYLFSQLKTRYGYKRDRWTTGVIEAGLKIKKGLLSPNPSQGTLLSNVTYALLQMALRPGKSLKQELDSLFQDLPTALAEFRFDQLPVTRIIETVRFKSTAKKSEKFDLVTDLVAFKRPTQKADSLLVYSIRKPGRPNSIPQKLITCFPIGKLARQQLLIDAQSNDVPIRPRYNAVIRGLPASGVVGKRTVTSL